MRPGAAQPALGFGHAILQVLHQGLCACGGTDLAPFLLASKDAGAETRGRKRVEVLRLGWESTANGDATYASKTSWSDQHGGRLVVLRRGAWWSAVELIYARRGDSESKAGSALACASPRWTRGRRQDQRPKSLYSIVSKACSASRPNNSSSNPHNRYICPTALSTACSLLSLTAQPATYAIHMLSACFRRPRLHP